MNTESSQIDRRFSVFERLFLLKANHEEWAFVWLQTHLDFTAMNLENGTILGLDFDGVLSPGNTGTLRYAPRLAEMLERHPQVWLVLTTNWRETHSPQDLLDWLPRALVARVVGQAPLLPTMPVAGRRQRELEAWLATHGTRQWLAVDDTASLFDPACPHLHLVNGKNALDSVEMARLEARLTAMGA